MTLRRGAKGYHVHGGFAILVWRRNWIWFWSAPKHAIEADEARK